MTIKQFIKGIINPINWWYIIQAKYRKFIKKQYNKIYQEDNIDDMLYKVANCPNCYLNGVCNGNLPEEDGCGCDFKSMIISDKSCPNGRF